jgi:hypothetical protein
MTRTANPYTDHAARALGEIEHRDSYNSAVRETIKARATLKRQRTWEAAVEGRADLMEQVRLLAKLLPNLFFEGVFDV